jgi:hypothetical protein
MGNDWLSKVHRAIAIAGPFVLIAPLIYIAWFLVTGASSYYSSLVLKNYLVFFGMPYAAFFAYYMVVTLESGRGPIEVEFGSLKFKGAAGPLIFWLLIFLSVQLGFKLFWVDV